MNDEPAWLDGYRRRGFAHLPAVIGTAEADDLSRECARLAELPGVLDPDNLRTRVASAGARSTVERTVDRIDPVTDLSPTIADLASDDRIVGPVTAAVGAPVVLFKDKLILKPPGADGYAMHQDAAYWPIKPPAIGSLAAMLAIDASGAANGALELVPGLHHGLLTPAGVPSDLDPSTLPEPEMLTLEPGDLVLFSLLTPHRSARNASDRPRRALFFTFVPDDGTDQRAAYYEAQQRRLLDQLPPERRARAVFR
jgi:ectoine hydroxylase-related dioxygenase (phytanoyl-CoA dioxygenase family)